MRTALLLPLVLLAALPPLALGGDVVCQRRSGALVVRQDRCSKHETPVPLAVAGPPGTPGEPGDPGPPAVYPTVRDAAGRFVGVPAVAYDPDTDGSVWVVIRRMGDLVLNVPLTPQGPRSGGDIYFSGAGCTGTRLVPESDEERFLARVITIGESSYYASGPPTLITAASTAYKYDAYCEEGTGVFVPPDLCCQDFDPDAGMFSEAFPLDWAALGFVPPLRLDGIP